MQLALCKVATVQGASSARWFNSNTVQGGSTARWLQCSEMMHSFDGGDVPCPSEDAHLPGCGKHYGDDDDDDSDDDNVR